MVQSISYIFHLRVGFTPSSFPPGLRSELAGLLVDSDSVSFSQNTQRWESLPGPCSRKLQPVMSLSRLPSWAPRPPLHGRTHHAERGSSTPVTGRPRAVCLPWMSCCNSSSTACAYPRWSWKKKEREPPSACCVCDDAKYTRRARTV